MDSKTCTKCQVNKPISEFHVNSKGKYGKSDRCKPCANKLTVEYNKRHPIKVAARKYKITVEFTEKLLSREVCDICGSPPTSRRRNCIDHCHTTGIVRGLLCEDCNKGLGRFKDSPELLNKAVQYLKKKYA